MNCKKEIYLISIVENFSGYAWCINRNRQYVYFNKRLKDVIKEEFSEEIREGDSIYAPLKQLDPSAIDAWELVYEKSFAGESQHFVHQFYIQNRPVFLDLFITPVEENSEVVGVSCTAIDISDQILNEKMFNEAETRFRALVENSHDGIALLGSGGRLFYVTSSVNRILGYSKDELLGANPAEWAHPDDKKSLICTVKDLLHCHGKTITTVFRLRNKNGQWKWLRSNITNMLHERAIKALVFNFEDATERIEAQESLVKSEALYRSLFDKSPLPKWICDRESLAYLEVNETAIQHYGYSRVEFLRMSPYDIRPIEGHEELNTYLREESRNEFRNGLVQHVKKNGEIIFAEVLALPIYYKGKRAVLVIAHDITRTLSLQRQLMEEKVNNQIEINRITLDIQEKERAEIGKELHDNINQMLTTSKVYLEYVLDNPGQNELIEKSMLILNTSIEEIRRLSRCLVPPSLGDISLEAAISDLIDSIQLLKRHTIELDLFLDERILCEGLKVTIFRIIQEQLNNVIKYASATKIRISLEQKEKLLCIKIEDNGKGFDTRVKRKGIGITNILNRAEAYKGKVEFNSAPGKGCTLFVQFDMHNLD
jgi:PAS domain S-box-containing protein